MFSSILESTGVRGEYQLKSDAYSTPKVEQTGSMPFTVRLPKTAPCRNSAAATSAPPRKERKMEIDFLVAASNDQVPVVKKSLIVLVILVKWPVKAK